MALIEVPQEKLDEIRKDRKFSFITPQQVRNRIQVWASKLGCNRCPKDMHEISQNFLFCVTLSGVEYETFVVTNGNVPQTKSYWNFNISIIRREDIREERRKDYIIYERNYHAHLFFEIPVIDSFSDEKIEKWEDFCLRFLAKQVFSNKKNAKNWLKMKKLNSDFDD